MPKSAKSVYSTAFAKVNSTVNGMAEYCPLCQRPKESTSEYCNSHNAALTNLENGYASWNEGYGGRLSKEDYFNRLQKLSETGTAVRDLIRYLRDKSVVR